jgi:DtxR family Mn-dependent transcriptional regulator
LFSTGKKANTTNLARILGISPASVSEMILKLSGNGLIKNTPYYGFKLTNKGEKIAIELTRKHRILELFLQQHLGYEWDEVHDEAEKLEHVCSDKFINKLDKFLGYPKADPHGDPIPDRQGKMRKTVFIRLSEGCINKNYRLVRVNDTSNKILQYLKTNGIKLNSELSVEDKIDFDNSIVITYKGKRQLISKKMSENIYVSKIK